MTLNEALELLIPHTDDEYTDSIKGFFLTVASIAPDNFMSNHEVDFKTYEPVILTNYSLKKIYDSYQGKLTDAEYLTRVLIAGTHHLLTLDIKQPGKEWMWVAKLLHLLIYFAQHDLPQRIRETTTESRKWMNTSNFNHGIWQYCYEELQGDTLTIVKTELKQAIMNTIIKRLIVRESQPNFLLKYRPKQLNGIKLW